MSFSFESQGTNTYLVYKIGDNDDLDTLSLGMLTNNSIPGFAAASFMQMDTSKFIRYNISAKVSMSQLFSGPVNKKRLVGVFSGIADAMLSAEDYMLDPKTIILNQDYIFTDVATCETVLICLPVVNESRENPDWGMFFKNIMFSTQFDQTENCDHVAKIINFLNCNPVFSPTDFKAVLTDIQSAPAKKHPQLSGEKTARPSAIQPQKQPAEAPRQPAPKPSAEHPVQTASQPKPVREEIPVTVGVQTEPEEKISLFYLLQHYNKENAAKYKMQKAASKENQPARQTAKKQAAGKPPIPDLGFAIPGQSAPDPKPHTDFEIPGIEKTPAPAPAPKPDTYKKATVPEPPQPFNSQNRPIPETDPVGEIDFGVTEYFGDESDTGTVILGAENPEQPVIPHLIFEKNHEKIPVNKPVFRLGRDREYNDFAIADNRYIGHSHCHIITRNGEYFVVDDNSKNHTYVDGVFVSPGSEVKITHGQTLKLANEEFEFRLF